MLGIRVIGWISWQELISKLPSWIRW